MLNNKEKATDALNEALGAIARGWGAGDPVAYAESFTPDAEYVAYDGSRMTGRRGIAEGHRALFAGIMRGSRMTFETPLIRLVREDVAIVTVRGGIIMRWQRGRSTPSAKRMSTLTFVFTLIDGAWLVSAFQNTRYRPWDRTILGRIMSRSGSR